MTRLLIDEAPRYVLPSLACIIGANEAMLLQQQNYFELNEKLGKTVKDRKWIFMTSTAWRENSFPWLSEDTIQRVLKSLAKRGLLDSRRDLGNKKFGHGKWYSINRENFAKLDLRIPQNADKNETPNSASCGVDSPQIAELIAANCGVDSRKLRSLVPQSAEKLIEESATETTDMTTNMSTDLTSNMTFFDFVDNSPTESKGDDGENNGIGIEEVPCFFGINTETGGVSSNAKAISEVVNTAKPNTSRGFLTAPEMRALFEKRRLA